MIIGRLVRVDFDSFENEVSAAISEKEIGLFVEGDGLTAHGRASSFIAAIPAETVYMGHNGKIYPQYKYTEGRTQ